MQQVLIGGPKRFIIAFFQNSIVTQILLSEMEILFFELFDHHLVENRSLFCFDLDLNFIVIFDH